MLDEPVNRLRLATHVAKFPVLVARPHERGWKRCRKKECQRACKEASERDLRDSRPKTTPIFLAVIRLMDCSAMTLRDAKRSGKRRSGNEGIRGQTG